MTRARSALLLLAAAVPGMLLVLGTPARSADPRPRNGLVFILSLPHVSFEEVMAERSFDQEARGGGVGLMTTHDQDEDEQAVTRVLEARGVTVCSTSTSPRPRYVPGFGRLSGCEGPVTSTTASVVVMQASDLLGSELPDGGPDRRRALMTLGLFFRATLVASPLRVRGMLMVSSPSAEMHQVGDEVTPIIMKDVSVAGTSHSNLVRALTSDTTRQDGLVANVDVAPTILDFFGIPAPDGMTGSPIRIDGTADVAHLHQLHLDQRRIRLPLQLAEVAFVAFLGIVGIPLLIWIALGNALPSRISSSMRFLCLCGVALLIPLMAGGLLPRLTYAVVVPFVVLSTIGLAALAQAARWRGPLGPFVFLGAASLAFIVVDALFGWRGMRVPLIGGTMFDGVRFYGLPNVFIAVLVAGTLFVAMRLESTAGAVLLFAAGLFAGFPALGANLGAAMTLFVAAGVWWVVRSRARLGVQELLFVAGVVTVGIAAVLLANRYLPGAPTHITGFVERTRGGFGGIWDAFRRRLDVGIGQIEHVPAAWIPLIGLPVVLVVAIVRPVPIRTGLDLAGTAWRHVLVVLTVVAMASFFANDTGVAAAAPAFLYAATGMAYPVFLAAGDR